MNETYTIKQVIEITRDQLASISVKIADFQTIGQPINAAVNNLNAVIQAMTEAEKKPEEVVEQHEDDNDTEGDT